MGLVVKIFLYMVLEIKPWNMLQLALTNVAVWSLLAGSAFCLLTRLIRSRHVLGAVRHLEAHGNLGFGFKQEAGQLSIIIAYKPRLGCL